MKHFAILVVSAFAISLAAANDQIRDVQAELKNRGFYYGEADGADGQETTAAIRRFQIRNGLTVTGKINAETLAALGLSPKGAPPMTPPTLQPPPTDRPMSPQVNPPSSPGKPAPDSPEAIPPGRKRKDMLREPEPYEETARVPRRTLPDDPSVIDPPAQIPGPVYTPFSTLFRGTPYDNAPRVVQLGTVRRAQALMAAKRLYRGAIDGIPSPDTSEAIFAYQEMQGLSQTGRLDLDTLSEMRLLPRSFPRAIPVNPFYNPNRRRDSSVQFDYWIR